ncbi:mRNA 3' end processing factor [Gurleya vavrai]
MEAIKNILKDTRSSFKIKSNVIVMLAKSNKSQAQQIIFFLNENLDDEGKNEIFMKLNNFCEYQIIFEEMKIEIKEEQKEDENVLNIEELNCKEIIEENSKICAEENKCDNYIPNTNLCNKEDNFNPKKQNIELNSKNNISDLVAEIRRAQALKKEKLKNFKENNEVTIEENHTEKFTKKEKDINNLDILHNVNTFEKYNKKENNNREIAQDENNFEKIKQKDNFYNKNDLLFEQKNLENLISKENNKNVFFENNNSKKEESNIANKKSTIDEKLRESQLNNMILKKRQNFEEITNKKYKNDENYQILNDTNKNSHIKNVSYNKFALQTNKKNFFNVNKLGLPIELSFYKKREHFDNFKSPNFNNFQNTNLSNNKQMNYNIKNNFSPNLFNNKLSPNLYNNNVLFNVNQNCNTLNQNYNNLQNNLNRNFHNLQNNLNRNVHENNKNLNQNYNNLHNNLNQNVLENNYNFNQNINENSNNIINLHENSLNNMQMPENKNSFNLNTNLSMHENRIKYDPNLLINFLMFNLKCNICGLRFNENSDGQSKLVKHVDEHSRQKRILENELNTGREYFSSFFDFINNIAKISIELPKEEEEIQKIKAENANCFICKRRIEKKWCDDDDEWILDDCVMIEDKKYCHRNCVI